MGYFDNVLQHISDTKNAALKTVYTWEGKRFGRIKTRLKLDIPDEIEVQRTDIDDAPIVTLALGPIIDEGEWHVVSDIGPGLPDLYAISIEGSEQLARSLGSDGVDGIQAAAYDLLSTLFDSYKARARRELTPLLGYTWELCKSFGVLTQDAKDKVASVEISECGNVFTLEALPDPEANSTSCMTVGRSDPWKDALELFSLEGVPKELMPAIRSELMKAMTELAEAVVKT